MPVLPGCSIHRGEAQSVPQGSKWVRRDKVLAICLAWINSNSGLHTLQLPQGRSNFVPSRQSEKFLLKPRRLNCTSKSQVPLEGQRVKADRFKHRVNQTWLHTFLSNANCLIIQAENLGQLWLFLVLFPRKLVIKSLSLYSFACRSKPVNCGTPEKHYQLSK